MSEHWTDPFGAGFGLAGQMGQVGPGRARAGLAGQAWSNNTNRPNYLFFGPIAENTTRVQIIGQIGVQEKTSNYSIFWKTLHTVQ